MAGINVGECNPSPNVLHISGNFRVHKGYAESVDQPPLQQVRTVIQTFDNQLEKHPIFTHPPFT